MTSLWKNFQHTWNILGFTGNVTIHFISDNRPPLTSFDLYTPSRYLNNPEAMGGAAYFGLALISGSKLVLSLAVIRHLANWWFLSSVEQCVLTQLIFYILKLHVINILDIGNFAVHTCVNYMAIPCVRRQDLLRL